MKEYLLIKLKDGKYIMQELEDVETISVVETKYWYKEKEIPR
jgi:hypothetical protein